ncbi:putative site-specific recombinase [Anaerovibrio sp. JC8]|uniref:recombinase family protein n=1 Tax=Anaerovibrio sp. JC8 TaxID=1240085 RepID=UPI000A0B30C8|nr:recombinase family protein [Anaerovibrio sp. JC8]ORU01508.1 putative site-specific recombinase [Anaerovibrio sp. JC8]
MKRITKVPLNLAQQTKKKRVAAYARVSVETERTHHSLGTQITYYNELIRLNPAWEFAGIYYDEGISGTSRENRDGFNRLIKDAEAGRIDIILTKSISRFARNTIDLLKTIRHLKEIGVEVRFEKENLSTFGMEGEFWITVLASFAEEEVQSIRRNVKWGIRKRFKQGLMHGGSQIYGYRWVDGNYVIVPEEAEVVRHIFANYLAGISAEKTAKELKGIKAFRGGDFDDATIRGMLGNITYTGNLLLQKKFYTDDIEHRKIKNNGELPQYYVENSHEPIIDMATFEKVQKRIAERRKELYFRDPSIPIYPYTGKIICGNCGKNYIRCGRDGWCCSSKKYHKACDGINLNEKMLEKITEGMDFTKIEVAGDELLITLSDGKSVTKKYISTARADYWADSRNVEKHRRCLAKGKRASKYTGLLKCTNCGEYFCHRKNEAKGLDYWRCKGARRPMPCSNWNLKTSLLESLIPETEGIERIDVSDGILSVNYESGGRKEIAWKEE